MHLEVSRDFGAAPVLHVNGNLGAAGAMHQISGEIAGLRQEGQYAVCIDLSKSCCNGFAGAFALVEVATREAQSTLAFFEAPKALIRCLEQSDMMRFLNVHIEESAAQASVGHRQNGLSVTDAVVLCAGRGTRMGRLSELTPKPMLDILGKPALERIIDHLASQGIGRVVLNPGHLGPQIQTYFRASPVAPKVSFFPEGDWVENAWRSEPLGSASTLLNLHHKFRAISGDIVVVCGDALTDIDLVAMMAQHKRTRARITIATKSVPFEHVSKYGIIVTDEEKNVVSFQEKPTLSEAKSNLANVGIYIISEEVLEDVPLKSGLDLANDLLPHAMKNSGTVFAFQDAFDWLDIGSSHDYFSVISDLLDSERPWISPVGQKIRPGLWIHETADVARPRNIFGNAYIGAGSTVHRTAKIEGPVSVGAGCRINAFAKVSKSLVLNKTTVQKSTKHIGAVVSDDWSIQHTPPNKPENVISENLAPALTPVRAPLLRAS